MVTLWKFILSWMPKLLFKRVVSLWVHPLYKWLVAGGTGVLVGLAVYLKGRKPGRKYADVKRAKELKRNVKLRKKIEDDLANDSDSSLDEQLRNWTKE